MKSRAAAFVPSEDAANGMESSTSTTSVHELGKPEMESEDSDVPRQAPTRD
jgi:hypothetical protein